ncbi:hypothetical protein [Natrarchaeobaculum aegyptiacum]|uniref:Uncharacterized protein n=1 Tax=Natrarchaeobaculum aegyptiacum TaxID=745377 RepID=A0A2Z2HVU4_9EURY|nr:hypothetical protein [Natrarchaeobaculum aegyptiacum]ARS90903.1 hypothetical protein B1756_14980 [Natrarchaeobaculum aegyptiacum]
MSGEPTTTTEQSSRRASTPTDATSTFDRRAVLRTLASGGYALGVAGVLGVDDFLATDDDDPVEVVTALVREDPSDPFSLEERTREVPAGWYEAVSTALEVNDLLSRVGFTGYLGSAVVPGPYEDESAAVSVGVSTEDSSIPEMIREIGDGVSFDRETIVDVEGLEDGPDDLEPRLATPVDDPLTVERPLEVTPSGVACETSSSLATLGPALYDPERQRGYFATAEHAFEEVDDPIGESLRLPLENAEPLELGVVDRAYEAEDVALIEPTDGIAPSGAIHGTDQHRVRGQLTKFGVADLIARDERLEKVGAMTGHTTGQIQGIDAVTCFTDRFCRRGQIRWGGEMDLTDGDSGSVSYYPDPEGDPEDVLVAGFNNARTWWPGQSYVWGVAAYTLYDDHGYHF